MPFMIGFIPLFCIQISDVLKAYWFFLIKVSSNKILRDKQMEIYHSSFQYTSKHLSLFFLSQFISTISITICAAECLKMKLLIDIFTVLCRILK